MMNYPTYSDLWKYTYLKIVKADCKGESFPEEIFTPEYHYNLMIQKSPNLWEGYTLDIFIEMEFPACVYEYLMKHMRHIDQRGDLLDDFYLDALSESLLQWTIDNNDPKDMGYSLDELKEFWHSDILYDQVDINILLDKIHHNITMHELKAWLKALPT